MDSAEAGARPKRSAPAAGRNSARDAARPHGPKHEAVVSEAASRSAVHPGAWQWPCDGRGVANRLRMEAAGHPCDTMAYDAGWGPRRHGRWPLHADGDLMAEARPRSLWSTCILL